MKKPAPAPTGTGSDLRRDTLSTKQNDSNKKSGVLLTKTSHTDTVY